MNLGVSSVLTEIDVKRSTSSVWSTSRPWGPGGGGPRVHWPRVDAAARRGLSAARPAADEVAKSRSAHCGRGAAEEWPGPAGRLLKNATRSITSSIDTLLPTSGMTDRPSRRAPIPVARPRWRRGTTVYRLTAPHHTSPRTTRGFIRRRVPRAIHDDSVRIDYRFEQIARRVMCPDVGQIRPRAGDGREALADDRMAGEASQAGEDLPTASGVTGRPGESPPLGHAAAGMELGHRHVDGRGLLLEAMAEMDGAPYCSWDPRGRRPCRPARCGHLPHESC
jgi:hypothetical protein